ncbi:Endonuclease V [Aquisphaera giovannonii]|uniref:Endonuclease V n=2 Tax=Aquisphaera giovannonii TaxID=406548 RepID=A0A5B9W7S2_9BACT|nr:Endonuclease V [Aquisphaera giovannonii]
MIAAVDVDYREAGAVAACVCFRDRADERAAEEVVLPIARVEPYEPGRFFRRELPCLLAVLGDLDVGPEVVIVDGYAWLGDGGVPGLGAHLFEALGRRVAVVGVAKTRFRGALAAEEVHRGAGHSPLYVTAAGMDLQEAARFVREMHGPYRIPTLLKRVDQLCRGLAGPIPCPDVPPRMRPRSSPGEVEFDPRGAKIAEHGASKE